ncbi:hypothetical protein [Kamptonema formosum]|uniref:hypothetical protein n=1 Tax=Kamptonema formosum TaxID=331992 RepID=UPI00034BC856|nr:hypothetical protein [Oscillatoria sp. PCC 10802]
MREFGDSGKGLLILYRSQRAHLTAGMPLALTPPHFPPLSAPSPALTRRPSATGTQENHPDAPTRWCPLPPARGAKEERRQESVSEGTESEAKMCQVR